MNLLLSMLQHGAGAAATHSEPHVIFGMNPLWVAAIVFVASYAVIMSEKYNRAMVALLILHAGAALHHQFIKKDGSLKRMWFGKTA